jgi:hypothetical protein
MSLFLRLLGEDDKGAALEAAVRSVATGAADARVFEVDPESFGQVPGAPFAYWVTHTVRDIFRTFPAFLAEGREARQGASSTSAFRYIRLWFESQAVNVARDFDEVKTGHCVWVPFAEGGAYSAYHADLHLLMKWKQNGHEVKEEIATWRDARGCRGWGYSWSATLNGYSNYGRPGLTWPLRTNGLSFRAMPAGCIFGAKGPAAFVEGDDPQDLLPLCAVVNSAPFLALVSLQLARTELAQSFEVGLIQQTPVPELSRADTQQLADLARRAWSLKRSLDTATLNSHALILPALLQVAG